jgi:hypothetical protein
MSSKKKNKKKTRKDSFQSFFVAENSNSLCRNSLRFPFKNKTVKM